jgi:hypothetical protein
VCLQARACTRVHIGSSAYNMHRFPTHVWPCTCAYMHTNLYTRGCVHMWNVQRSTGPTQGLRALEAVNDPLYLFLYALLDVRVPSCSLEKSNVAGSGGAAL